LELLGLLAWGHAGWGDEIASGVFITVTLALATLPFGLALGFFVALAKQSDDNFLRLSANIFTTIFRGLPELLTIFLIFYGGQIALRLVAQAMGFEQGIEINAFVAGMIALGIVFAAYSSEVFLSAFRAIPQGQYEAGDALGMRRGRTLRLVVLPQLIRLALPGLGNLWLILLKETALVSVIGLNDTIRQTGIAARVTKEPFLFFGVACAVYLILALISSVGVKRIENYTEKHEGAR